MQPQFSFLFHDYETWGINPKYDFACQFAAIRTDYDLNIIESPHSYYCQIANDYLPHPMACLVTGITPQQSLRDGLIESEFAAHIHKLMLTANTCSVGYNSIKFDDEVSRNLFYRNFYDPYEREYKNENSRWDIIDLTRACFALRPDGINWVIKDDGRPSFKLEELSVANGIEHSSAHDAVADVEATIAFAKQLKNAQPKLFDYYFNLRQKKEVNQLITYDLNSPLIYISGSISPYQACLTIVLPICQHPVNNNAIICIDLATDLNVITEKSVEQIKQSLYAKTISHDERPGIRVIHANKSPFLATVKLIDETVASRCKLNLQHCRNNLSQIKTIEGLSEKLVAVFDEAPHATAIDIDASLYTRGFASSADKQMNTRIRQMEPEQLAGLDSALISEQTQAQLFRYRARNYPNTLNADELEKWQRHRHMRFSDTEKPTSLSAQEYQQTIVELSMKYANNPKKMGVLQALERYLNSLY